MVRRVNSLAAIDLLACFAILVLVQVVSPLQLASFDPDSGVSAPASSIGRYAALEVPAAAADLPSPRQLGSAIVEHDFVSDSSVSPMRRYAVLPLGPFWTGRILRRISSEDPDGH